VVEDREDEMKRLMDVMEKNAFRLSFSKVLPEVSIPVLVRSKDNRIKLPHNTKAATRESSNRFSVFVIVVFVIVTIIGQADTCLNTPTSTQIFTSCHLHRRRQSTKSTVHPEPWVGPKP
jgi:hypothetical protein